MEQTPLAQICSILTFTLHATVFMLSAYVFEGGGGHIESHQSREDERNGKNTKIYFNTRTPAAHVRIHHRNSVLNACCNSNCQPDA